MKNLYFVLGLFFMAPFAVQAQEAKHPCQAPDLAGLWQTAGYQENPPGPLTANYKNFPYEYLIFDDHGDFVYEGRQTAADVNFKGEEDLTNFVKEIYTTTRLSGSKFNFSVESGILTVLRDARPWQRFQCFIVDADLPNGMKRDDMIWLAPSVMRIERRVLKK